MIACGGDSTFATTETGMVVSFGDNKFGQLGRPESQNDYPMNTDCIKDGKVCSIRQVSSGKYHTGLVSFDGDLFMCGEGVNGELGLRDKEDRMTPTQVPRERFGGDAVLMVACGYVHTAVVTKSGGVYTFGYGGNGQLGHGNYNEQLAPIQVAATGFRPGGSAEGPSERIVMVAAGGQFGAHTVALSEAGHVFTWGAGSVGQLGHDDQNSHWAPRQVKASRFASRQGEKVVFVAAGGSHTVAVTAGGRLYTWGNGSYGQLGHGDDEHQCAPKQVAPEQFENSAVVMAACGVKHTLVVTEDGALWACGCGEYGKLGLNDETDRHSFELVGAGGVGGMRVVVAAAGDQHSAAVTEDGALWTWGFNFYGQLGGREESNSLQPKKVTTTPNKAPKFGGSSNLSTKMQEQAVLALTKTMKTPEQNTFEPALVEYIVQQAKSFLPEWLSDYPGLRRLLGERPTVPPSSKQKTNLLTVVCQRCQIQASSA